MSFLDRFKMMNTLSESTTSSYDYPYDEFLDDITMIESTMYHEINNIKDNASINAIHALCEGVEADKEELNSAQVQANSIKEDSIKKANEKAIKQIEYQYNKVRKQLDDLNEFISNNKRDIMNTTIGSSYLHYSGKCIKITGDIKTYNKILKKFTTNKEFYSNIEDPTTWLGESVTVTSDIINKRKEVILKNISLLDKCITKYQETELRLMNNLGYDDILKRVKTVKSCYRNVIKYCAETKKVLIKFVSHVKEGNE